MPSLFDPLRLGALTVPNRIFMAPLTRCRAGEEHIANALMAEHYRPEQKPIRRRFEEIARLFEDQMHDFGLSMLVRAAHADRREVAAGTCRPRSVAVAERRDEPADARVGVELEPALDAPADDRRRAPHQPAHPDADAVHRMRPQRPMANPAGVPL